MRNELTYQALMGKKIPTEAEGRKCQYKDCTTRLSIYNYGKYCFAHNAKGVELDDIIALDKFREKAHKEYEKKCLVS
jgi:hypothetical protein